MFDWESKVKLNPGETVQLIKSSTKGFMEETDVMIYNVINATGEKVGTVDVEDHTAVRGFRRTVHIKQRTIDGRVLVNESWNA